MLLHLPQILNAEEVRGLRERLADAALWIDGRSSAGGQAAAVKRNEQLAQDHPLAPQLQAQVLHWPGETWRGGQWAQETVVAAVAALKSCQAGNPSASASLVVNEPDRVAAAVSGPVVLHEYLLADPFNSTVTELALWSEAPTRTPWPSVTDSAVLDALGAPLCTAYIGSCP